jgi:hypothetical protein
MIDIEPLSFITGFSIALLLFIAYNLADFMSNEDDL